MRGIVAGIGIALVAANVSLAQDTPLDPHTSVAINFPPDSPVTLVSADMGESRASARGGAMVVDLHNMVLKLRNGAGDRVVSAPDFFREQGIEEGDELNLDVAWSVEKAALCSSKAFPS